MVDTLMLCGNGRSFSGRYHGWHMDALWDRRSLWGRYLSWHMDDLSGLHHG